MQAECAVKRKRVTNPGTHLDGSLLDEQLGDLHGIERSSLLDLVSAHEEG
jgi:hypothetical protein